jgi:hypothetical protein
VSKPSVGDDVAVDVAENTVYRRPMNGQWGKLDNVDIDLSKTDEFTVKGKHPPHIYSTTPPWEVTVKDQGESASDMRIGKVV